jgi:CheY-like chemotaxis protein
MTERNEARLHLESSMRSPGGSKTSVLRLHSVRVLVVDDCEVSREIARRVLERDGATVVLAECGLEAIEHLRVRPNALDVVLMDIQMPELDGCETTRRIRAKYSPAELPVIAVAAPVLSSERQRAHAAGIQDFVSKPYEASALTECILRHLSLAGAAPWPVIAGADADAARRQWGGDAEIYLSMLERLLGEFDAQVPPTIPRSSDEFAAYAKTLHKLRGGASVLQVKGIYKLADALEQSCHASSRDRVFSLSAELAEELGGLRQSVNRARANRDRRQPPSPSAPSLT